MTRFEIVEEHTRFDVTLRPGLPDLRVRVNQVQGWIDGAVSTEGVLDATQPLRGIVDLQVSGLHTHNRLLSTGLERLLGAATETEARIEVVGAQPHAPGTTAVELSVIVAQRDASMRTIVRIEEVRDEQLVVMGHTRCDPRAFGAALPPVVNLAVNVRWHLRLRPAPQ